MIGCCVHPKADRHERNSRAGIVCEVRLLPAFVPKIRLASGNAASGRHIRCHASVKDARQFENWEPKREIAR